MSTYLDRYQHGEHEAVWADLRALGRGVSRDEVYEDALAVARETMLRARQNVETLIVRLDTIGYRFDTARDTPAAVVEQMAEVQRTVAKQLEAQFPGLLADFGRDERFASFLAGFDKKLAPASTLDEASVFLRAQDWSGGSIARLEGFLGANLPLSWKAWYECVAHVSFIGSHPVLNPAEPRPDPLPDPFALMSLPDEVDYESWETEDGYPIAVDERFKANVSREHRYHVNFRDARADAVFQDWRGDYFVGHLRRVFRWGGFPGWERHPNPPCKLIEELTEGLVAL